MKTEKDKKYQAALAGVMMYLEEEQANMNAPIVREVPNQPDYWAHYGKQTIMANRGMMQMRFRKR